MAIFTDGITSLTAANLNTLFGEFAAGTGVRVIAGYFTVGAGPAWTGTTGVTVSRTSAGIYRITWGSSFTSVLAGIPVFELNTANCGLYNINAMQTLNGYMDVRLSDIATNTAQDVASTTITIVAIGVV